MRSGRPRDRLRDAAERRGSVLPVAREEAHSARFLVGEDPIAVVLLLVHPARAVEGLGDQCREHGTRPKRDPVAHVLERRCRGRGSPSAARATSPPSSRAIPASVRPEIADFASSAVDVLRAREGVAVLDEEPRGPCLARPVTARADEGPRTAQLPAVQRELELAPAQGLVHVGHLRLPAPAVPDHDRAAAVLAARDDALEAGVVERMIFGRHRETLDRGIERGPLRDGPRQEHAVPLEAEVVVEPGRAVLLDHVRERFPPAPALGPRAGRLRRDAEASLRAIPLKRHAAASGRKTRRVVYNGRTACGTFWHGPLRPS